MSARIRRAPITRTASPAIHLERTHCSVCREPALCGVADPGCCPLCFSCALSISQLIACAQRATDRPHARPCTCEACIVFEEGQRGEIARVVLIDNETRAEQSNWSVVEAAEEADEPEPERSRFSWLEVDT